MKDFLRNVSLSIRKKKFKKIADVQHDITIISNNCTGGIMYNDLGLRFMSPTINLFFGHNNDFFNYLNNFERYSTEGELVPSNKKETRKGFENSPIGLLKCPGLPDVELHFLHYIDFETAKRKWIERTKRINFEKVFVVIEAQEEYEKNSIGLYLTIKYPMVIFTDQDYDFDCCMKMPFYKKYGTGISCPILKLINVFGKRGYDSYDFVNNIFRYDFVNKKTN